VSTTTTVIPVITTPTRAGTAVEEHLPTPIITIPVLAIPVTALDTGLTIQATGPVIQVTALVMGLAIQAITRGR